MRKLALFLAVIMTLGLCISAPAAAETETEAVAAAEDSAYTKAVYLLEALGVGTLSGRAKTVTYNVFADALATALKGNMVGDIQELMAISYSDETGDGELLFSDAVRALVNIAGYKPRAEMNGGTVAAYVRAANMAGILDGLSFTDTAISVRDAAVLIYNTLNCGMLQSFYHGTSIDYRVHNGETVLQYYRDIAKGTGTVEANEYTGLYSAEQGSSEGFVKIGGVLYKDPQELAADLIGYHVEYYYTDDEDTYGAIFAAQIYEEKNKELVIDGNFDSYAGRTLHYYSDSGKRRSVKIAARAAVLYNGVALFDYEESVFNFTDSRAILIDNDADGIMDVVKIQEYVNWVVNYVDLEYEIIYDKLNHGPLDVNSNAHKRIRVFDQNGRKIQYFAIQAKDILSVFESKNGELIDIYVSKTQILGAVETTKAVNGEPYVTINGEEYAPTPDFANTQMGNIELGVMGRFYIDAYGKLAYMEKAEDILKYGYYMRAVVDGAFGTTGRIKILAADGEKYTYEFADRVEVDGAQCKNAASVMAALGEPGIIRYDVTDDGKLYMVDTQTKTNSESENSLTAYYSTPLKSVNLVVGQDCFNGTIKLTEGAPLFICPDSSLSTSEDDFGVLTMNNMVSSTSVDYDVNGYSHMADDYLASAAMITNKRMSDYQGLANGYNISFLVRSVETVLNEDGELVDRVNGYSRATEYSYLCTGKQVSEYQGDTIKKGDIVYATLDYKGRICDVYKFFDAETYYMPSITTIGNRIGVTMSDSYAANHRLQKGYIYYCEGGVIGIHDSKPDINNLPSKGELTYFNVGDYVGNMIDSYYPEEDVRHMKRLTVSEIKDFIHHNVESYAVVRTRNASVNHITVYQ